MKAERRRLVGLVAALTGVVLAAALALSWLLRAPTDPERPEKTVRRLWTERGIDKPNLVLITLDTTRADHLGCYGYAAAKTPNIDALANE